MASPKLDLLPYTIHNLPYGVISTKDNPVARCAVAIGEHVVDLGKYASTNTDRLMSIQHQLGSQNLANVFEKPSLNEFAALPSSTRKQFREQLQDDLKNGRITQDCLVLLSEIKPHLPMQIGGFSDFYTSLEHCQNCSGEMSSAASIAQNWYYAPSVYNSRVSSILPTPADILRPRNVYFTAGFDSKPAYGPSRKLDFELEMGAFVSKPIAYGETMSIVDAQEHIFGFVMLNDWSARDHQLFEMRPLGPFHSKGFGTSISNWIVPIEALTRFSCAVNTKQDPPPFEHLTWPTPIDATIDVKLRIKLIRNGEEKVLGTSNLKYLYWTPYQQIAHHAASGCGLATGDLIGTGTISGSGVDAQDRKAELGCLYEAEKTKTAVMPRSSTAYEEGYLEDGDEIVLQGWCEDEQGNVVLGFGDCRGRIVPPK